MSYFWPVYKGNEIIALFRTRKDARVYAKSSGGVSRSNWIRTENDEADIPSDSSIEEGR